jgi:hypothetical protein
VKNKIKNSAVAMLSVSILQSAIHQSKSHQSDQDLLELIDSIVGEELLNRAVGIIEGTGVKYRSTTKKSKYAITAICPPNRLQKLYYCVGDSFQQYVWWNPWICSCARSNDDQILRNNNNNNSLVKLLNFLCFKLF